MLNEYAFKIGRKKGNDFLIIVPLQEFMFNICIQLEKKAALEKYTDSLNKIIHDHVEQNPNTSPRDILLHHASNCELETYGEHEPVK